MISKDYRRLANRSDKCPAPQSEFETVIQHFHPGFLKALINVNRPAFWSFRFSNVVV